MIIMAESSNNKDDRETAVLNSKKVKKKMPKVPCHTLIIYLSDSLHFHELNYRLALL
jgi:hypothetical protein